jgi:hypothetical protein
MPLMRLLDQLDESRRRFSLAEAPRTARFLHRLAKTSIDDATALIRYHELLLFIRAYPVNAEIAALAESGLAEMERRVGLLADAYPLEEPEVSGIAGSGLTAVFSAGLARDLLRRHPGALSIHWEAWEHPERLGLVLPDLFPLCWDDLSVEAGVPYREWLEALGGLTALTKCTANQYDALEIPLRWEFGSACATRSLMRLDTGPIFYHQQPLITRREVSLDGIPASPDLPVRKLAKKRGDQIIAMARDTSAVRYRELHGFTYGDPLFVYEFNAGRGVLIYVWGVPPESRLPLRVYHAAAIWKNGVPIGYFEGLTLAERMEAGFNLYYTFREGETAWLYGRLLKVFHQMLGVTCFVLDPYQIGNNNEEAIQSGAFWFYRKLGFHSTDARLRDLTAREEKKIGADPAYRVSARTLRKLVREHMIYGFPGAPVGDWYGFEMRRVGMTVARQGGWNRRQLGLLRRMLKAKQEPEEVGCLHIMRADSALRAEILRLGKEEAISG